MQNRRMPVLAIAVAMAALSGCASTGMDAAEKLAAYQAAAGEPVDSFNYFGRINGWTPLDDRHIAVWTRPREAFLLTFAGSCSDIDFAPVISLTSQANRVYAGFDKVMAHNRTGIQMPCRIQEIRPLDTARVKAAEKAARDGAQDAASGT